MAFGTCRHCGHQPVAFDAPICPECAGHNPNPSQATRRGGIVSTIGGIVGGIAGVGLGTMVLPNLLEGLQGISAVLVGIGCGAGLGFFLGELVGRALGSSTRR